MPNSAHESLSSSRLDTGNAVIQGPQAVSIFYFFLTNYYQLRSIKQQAFTTSQFRGSEVCAQCGLVLCSSLWRLQSGCHLGCIFICRLE